MGQTTEVVCASVIADEAGRVCLVRESKPQALNRWSLPGGRAETGESLREAAAREALEETGLTVEIGSLLGIYHSPRTLEGGSAVSFVFAATATAGTLTTSPDHPDVRFFDRAKIGELIDARLLRGTHAALALDAHRAGLSLDESLITEVPPARPPGQ